MGEILRISTCSLYKAYMKESVIVASCSQNLSYLSAALLRVIFPADNAVMYDTVASILT